jgi:hypothetical protein
MLLALAGWSAGRVSNPPPTISSPAHPLSSAQFGQLPLSFVPNTGQADPQVRFQASGLGGTLFFTPNEIVLALPRLEESGRAPRLDRHPNATHPQAAKRAPLITQLRFEDPNPATRMLGGQILPGKANYFQGNDPARWHTNVATYAGITYSALYPGVDLHYDGANGRLKGTYTVAPGADPSRIRWRYNGAAGMQIDSTTGDLRIELSEDDAPLIERAPVAWQQIDRRHVPVAVRYIVGRDGAVGFALGRYDPTRALTIDPTLEYSTFLGGSGLDVGNGIVADQSGNIYVTGSTTSPDFPISTPVQATYGGATCQFPHIYGPCTDAFVAKFNSNGQLVYSTYLGGDQQDTSVSIAVDRFGSAYITGDTWSTNFPASRALLPPSGGGGEDGFVAKLGPSGSTLVYGLYLGGNSADHPHGIAVDTSGAAIVTGETLSTTFPAIHAMQSINRGEMEGFVTKVATDGRTLIFSTYLGGDSSDNSQSVALDNNGAIYLTGLTTSSNFPIANPFQSSRHREVDAFVTKLRSDGSSIIYSTYFGGDGGDSSYDIAVDSAGSAYIAGLTYSANLPLLNPAQAQALPGNNAFVAKFSPAGNTLSYSTFIGNDAAYSVAVDADGYAYVTGYTQSESFPLEHPIQARLQGQVNSFVTKLNRAGNALLFSSYLGGSTQDYGYGIDVDNAGHIYVAGRTFSSDFPTVHAFQPTDNGIFDNGSPSAFVARIHIPTTTIVNTLVDALTNQPLPSKSGVLSIYRDTTLIETAPFTTNAQGVYQATFSGPISGSLRLNYSQIDGYPSQFEDRQPSLAQADQRVLQAGSNLFTTRLSPFTTLTNTLLDDVSGEPIVGKSGTLTVYSGTLALETQPFQTDQTGVFNVSFTQLISQVAKLEYSSIPGYPNQYLDRRPSLGQADTLRLVSGSNRLSTRLAPFTMLVNTLRDDTTGQVIANAHGRVIIYSGPDQLDSQPFQTDAAGVFTVAFTPLISQSVRLEYTEIAEYPTQSYDRALFPGQSSAVFLRPGINRLDTRLIPSTTLANTLLDERSGLPIGLKTGSVLVYSGTTILERAPFTTNAQGLARITFSTHLSRSVQLGYLVDGYFNQYYDRVLTQSQATDLPLRYGVNLLTTRLIPATRLVNTLLDDTTGLPIGLSSGMVNVYSGTMLLESRSFTTDASGVYTTTFQHMLDQDVALEYQVGSYARQFYDRTSLLGQATLVAMHSGRNTLTTRLGARATLVNTLLDDVTGQPIANTNGVLTTYLAGTPVETQYFLTDASGVYTTTFNRLLDQPAWLEYGQVKGFARQFYNRALRSDQASAISLQAGKNTLTARLLRAPTLVNTLLDDSTGLPIKNTSGFLQLFLGTQYLEAVPFITNASGVYSATLSNTPVGARATLAYSPMNGYATQYYDRKARLSQADSVLIDAGQTQLTTRLVPATTLVNTLLNGATGRPIRNVFGSIEVISGTTRLDLRSFTTDASGVFTATLSGIINQDAKLRYYVNGYPQQYYDGRLVLGQADSVRLASGINRLTTHLLATTLSNTLVNDATGLPIRMTTGAVEVYSGTMLLERQQFQTDSSGVYTTTFATLLDQQVVLKYQVSGYPTQFADRKLAFAQADPIHLSNGLNQLSTRLLATVLINTLLDDVTGQPIGNATGSLGVYSGTMLLEQQPFRTDASGVYTTTFQHLISRDVRLGYQVATYANQFYDRTRTLDQATQVRLASGISRLTSRLLPATVLVNRLIDNIGQQPIHDAAGTITLYDGATQIENAQFTTDATGVFTATFTNLISESVRIGYRVEGYPQQYADRQLSVAQANTIALHSGINALDTQLLPMPSAAITLIDDPTGQPIPNISGWLTVHWSGGQEAVPFTTDASGVYTATFRTDSDSTVPISQGVLLEYSYIPGYIDQYYDRVYTSVEAKPVFFQSGLNRLSTRITRPPTTLSAKLMDGPYPITSKHVHVSIERTAGVLFEQDYMSDGNGTILIEAGWLVGTDFRLRFHVEGFPDQYIGGTTRFDHALLVPLYSMANYRTFEIARYPTLFNTLVDDSSGVLLANIVGQLRVYTDTNSFVTFPFDTDDNGVMILQTEGVDVVDDNVRLEYLVNGYSAQFYDRKASYAEADPVLLQNGTTTFTTRLSGAILPTTTPTPPPATPTPLPATPPPPPIIPGQIRPETGGWLRYNDTTTFTLSFPPGAVTEPISVTITSQPAEHIVLGTRPIGPAFDIQAHNAAGTPAGHVEQPLTIEIQFDARDTDAIDERSLYIAYWDPAAGAWLPLPSQYDSSAHTISALVDHLGQFAVFGQPVWKLYLPFAQR